MREFGMREKDRKVDFNISRDDIDVVINDIWDRDDKKSRIQDFILEKIQKQHPSTSEIEDIYIKVSLLNDFYSTSILDTWGMANHIKNLNLSVIDGNPDIVNQIAKIKYNDKEYNMYSFATKYCSLHNPEKYPIYDGYVEDVLIYLMNTGKIHNLYTTQQDLRDYSKFRNALNIIDNKLGNIGYKKVDMYLWALGKKYFSRYEE